MLSTHTRHVATSGRRLLRDALVTRDSALRPYKRQPFLLGGGEDSGNSAAQLEEGNIELERQIGQLCVKGDDGGYCLTKLSAFGTKSPDKPEGQLTCSTPSSEESFLIWQRAWP